MMNGNFFNTDLTNRTRQVAGVSYVRLFHAAPGAPEADIYANGKLIGKRLSYGQFTDYIAMPAGTYNIEAFPVGLKDSPILSVNIPLAEKTVYTLSLIGILPQIGILPVEDEYQAIPPGRVNIRFANLSPNAPGLNLSIKGGPLLFTDINYTEVSDYITMHPGNYNFIVQTNEVGMNVVYVPNMRLLPNRNLTFYVVGMFGQQPSSLEVYVPLDGTTYLRDF